jgi:branched-chain amino acid transport system ATP-binding protein
MSAVLRAPEVGGLPSSLKEVPAAALELQGVCKNYGALQVTRDVNLTLQPGARHALIGPNGAGKSTLVHLITGLVAPTRGKMWISGKELGGRSPERRVKLGLGRTFQINSLFTRLSVGENVGLALAAAQGMDSSMGKPLQKRPALMDEAGELLRSLGLLDLVSRTVSDLAYGQRRLVEIALALALKPKVLLLDEPVAGVPSTEGKRLFELLERLPQDVATLVIEHDMELVFRFAERITVLVEGAVLLEASVDEVRSSKQVRDVYLGGGRSHG